MDGFLKQSTAVRVGFGPFVSSSDGHTRQTGLTVAQAEILLSKAGGAYAQTNNSKGAYHSSNGNYWATLDATDTNTLGILKYDIDNNIAMSVFGSFQIVSRQRYNQLFSSTDTPVADVTQVSGSAVNTASAQLGVNVVNLAGSAVQQTGGHIHAYDDAGNALATLSATSTLDRNAVRDAVSSTLDRAAVLATLINDGTRLDGSRLNTCSSLDTRNKLRLALFDADTRADISRLNTCASFDRDGLRESIFTVNRQANLSVGGTIDATSQASSATSTLDRTKIRSALLTDATRFAGANIANLDAAVSGASTLDRNAVRDAVGSTLDRAACRAAIIDDDTRLDGSRLNTCNSIDTRSKLRLTLFDGDTRADISRLNETCTIDSRSHMRLTMYDADTRADISRINSLDESLLMTRKMKRTTVNKLVVWETTGSADIYDASGVKLGTVASAFTSDSKKTTRLKLDP